MTAICLAKYQHFEQRDTRLKHFLCNSRDELFWRDVKLSWCFWPACILLDSNSMLNYVWYITKVALRRLHWVFVDSIHACIHITKSTWIGGLQSKVQQKIMGVQICFNQSILNLLNTIAVGNTNRRKNWLNIGFRIFPPVTCFIKTY